MSIADTKLASKYNCLSWFLQGYQIDLAVLDVEDFALLVVVVEVLELVDLSFEEYEVSLLGSFGLELLQKVDVDHITQALELLHDFIGRQDEFLDHEMPLQDWPPTHDGIVRILLDIFDSIAAQGHWRKAALRELVLRTTRRNRRCPAILDWS